MKKYTAPIVDVFMQTFEEIMADVISSSGNINMISWEDFVNKSDVSNDSGL